MLSSKAITGWSNHIREVDAKLDAEAIMAIAEITREEDRALNLVRKDMSLREVAQEMDMSHDKVDRLYKRAQRKLGCADADSREDYNLLRSIRARVFDVSDAGLEAAFVALYQEMERRKRVRSVREREQSDKTSLSRT